MFKNMKIGLRLGLGFSLIMIFMIAVIAAGIGALKKAHEDMENIVTLENVRTQLANSMIDNVRESAIDVRDVILFKYEKQADKKMQEIKDHLAQTRKEYDADTKKLRSLYEQQEHYHSPGHDKQLDKAEAIVDTARKLQDKVIALAQSNKTDEATGLMNAQAYPTVKRWIQYTDDLVKTQNQHTLMAYSAALKRYNLARALMLMLGTLAVALAVILSLTVTRSITIPLKVATALVVSRDLTMDISKYKEGQGELGMMIRNFSREITERVRTEEELLESKEQLEQRVIERTQELQAVNEEMIATNQELNASNEEITAANEELQDVQEELKRQREEQQIILDSVPAWVFYKDKENRFIRVNQAFADVLGMPKEQLEGKSMAEIYPREQAEAFWVDDLKVIESGQPERNIVESMKSPKGTLWVQTDKIPYHDAQGKIIGIIGFKVDITQRKQMEDSIKEHAAKMEAMNKELESFAYSVSHDLRVPLRAIDGFTKIVTEDYNEKFDDEGKRLLGVIRDNTRKMGRLIDDLLLFSKVGRQELAGTEVDMRSLAETVSKEFKAQNEDRNITFKIGQLPSTKGDQAMLRQVLANLVGNAVKFTRPREKALVEISGTTQDTENIYSIKDNGVGFDMQYAPKLFGVFQRLHSHEEFEGTGVGLAIVQRIILKHGGRVWAEGKVGEGATLFFALPNLA